MSRVKPDVKSVAAGERPGQTETSVSVRNLSASSYPDVYISNGRYYVLSIFSTKLVVNNAFYPFFLPPNVTYIMSDFKTQAWHGALNQRDSNFIDQKYLLKSKRKGAS